MNHLLACTIASAAAIAMAMVGACSSDDESAVGGSGTGATGASTSSAGGQGNAGVGGSGATGAAGAGTTGSGATGGAGAGGAGGAELPTDPNECASPDASWIFCCDFEQGDLSMWDDYDGNPDETNHLMAEPGPFGLADNQVVRLRVPAGRGGADLVKVLPDSYDRLFARWWVEYEPSFDLDAPNHGSGLHAGDRNWLGHSDTRPSGDDWFSGWIEHLPTLRQLNVYSYYRGMYQDCVDPNGSCWGDHFPCLVDEGETFCEKPQHRETVNPPVMATGRWYCLEMMMDGATPVGDDASADGQLDFWVDGEEMGPWTDLWLRTTPDLKLGILWLSIFHHEEHSVEGLYFDNVVVSTERIGCY
jgi:hypothetical protein